MKNKLLISLLRWVGQPLLLAGLLAWAVAPSYSSDAAGAGHPVSKPTESNAAAKSARNADVQELKGRLKELEDATRQNYMLELDGQREQVDWWLTSLGIMVGIIALFGTLFPFLIARKNKEIIEQDITQIKQLLADAKSSVEKIRQHETEAAKAIMNFQSGTPTAEGDNVIHDAVKKVKQDEESDYLLRFRADAIIADQAKDAAKAYKLWGALAELVKDDASAQFNAGYWALKLGNSARGAETLHWLRLAGKHYVQALSLKPNMHEAAHNWALALVAEASALATTEPDAARALREQAREKYQLAQSIKPDYHKTDYNRGNNLFLHAKLCAKEKPEIAANLLNQAEQLLLASSGDAPEMVAYTLACIYGLRADVQGCLKWLQISQTQGVLPDCVHLSGDKDLDAVRDAPEFVEWFKQVCP